MLKGWYAQENNVLFQMKTKGWIVKEHLVPPQKDILKSSRERKYIRARLYMLKLQFSSNWNERVS